METSKIRQGLQLVLLDVEWVPRFAWSHGYLEVEAESRLLCIRDTDEKGHFWFINSDLFVRM